MVENIVGKGKKSRMAAIGILRVIMYMYYGNKNVIVEHAELIFL